MAGDEEVPIFKPPTFDGEKENYPEYMVRLPVFLGTKGLHDAIDPKFKRELPASLQKIDLSTLDGKEMKKAWDKNVKAMGYIANGFRGAFLMNLLSSVMSEDKEYPMEKAYQVMKLFHEECCPNDKLARNELMRELGEVTLGKGEDPKHVTRKIDSLKLKY